MTLPEFIDARLDDMRQQADSISKTLAGKLPPLTLASLAVGVEGAAADLGKLVTMAGDAQDNESLKVGPGR